MPGLDRGGPMGAGPMTGGKRGLCNRSGAATGQPTRRPVAAHLCRTDAIAHVEDMHFIDVDIFP